MKKRKSKTSAKKKQESSSLARKLSARGASKGGKARANSLTREERKEIARQAGLARWRKAGKAQDQPRNAGVSPHMGVMYQMLATWVLALEWLGKDPDTLTLQYEPPTGGDILFTLHSAADLTFCECKMRSKEPNMGELRKWFISLYRDHASEIAACKGEVTLTIVTSLRPGSRLYRAAANLRHRPGYLRGKLNLDDKAIPHACNLQIVHLPSDLEVLSAKIGWSLVSRLGLPLSPRTVQQHLHEIDVSLVQERHASGGQKVPTHRLQELLVDPLKKIAQEQIEVMQIGSGVKTDPAVERSNLEKLLTLQRAGGSIPTNTLRAKLHTNARLLVDVIDFCRRHPGDCKEALLSLVGSFRTEFHLFQELEKLVPSHVTWGEALDIAEAALRSNSQFGQQAALELLQKADTTDPVILERILRIAADAFAEHAGTDESNDHVLEEVGKLTLKLLPSLTPVRKREIVEDIFITCSQLLTDHSWYHFGTAPVLYDVAKELALESLENFLWFIDLLTEAHKEKGIYAVIPYRGYEDMGHGTSQVGSGFSTGDYNYAANILTPALIKFEAERPKGWASFWHGVCGKTVDAEHPVWLKRAAIPVLISQAHKGGKEGESALSTLKGYVSILRGIPSPSEILFEKLTHQEDMLNDNQRLSLIDADMHTRSVSGTIYPYPSSIFAFEVLFKLCISKEVSVREKAHVFVREFISCDKLDILQIERTESFSERLHLLLALPESKVLLHEIIAAFLIRVEGLLKIENYDEPTTCFVTILEKLFLENKAEGYAWASDLFLEEKARPYGQRVISGVMLHLVEKPETLALYEELHQKYSAFIEPSNLSYCEARHAEALQRQFPQRSLDACLSLLETSLKHPERHAEEYKESDKSMAEKDNIHFISGTEGHALFTLHQVAHIDPRCAYAIALRYWLESPSPYLRHMACHALRISISNLITGPKKNYLYEKAPHYLEEFAGKGLTRLQEYMNQWPAMWGGIAGVMNVLKHVLTYEEAQRLIEIGKGREGTEWAFFYFANYHSTQKTFAGPAWTKEQKEKMLEDFQKYLVEGDEHGVTHLLNDIRNIVRKGKCDAAHISMMDHVLRNRPKNDVHEMNTFGLALSDAKEHGDDQLFQFVEPFFDLWVIPLLKQIPEGGGFFYVHGCDDLVQWVQEKDSDQAVALAQRIVTLPDEHLHRMFRHLDIKTVAIDNPSK